MPEKLARSVVVTPCCRHHSLTERPLLRHSWICAAHSCSSARCFNSALVILTSHNTTVAKPFATFRYYCLMCVYARLGLTVTFLHQIAALIVGIAVVVDAGELLIVAAHMLAHHLVEAVVLVGILFTLGGTALLQQVAKLHRLDVYIFIYIFSLFERMQ